MPEAKSGTTTENSHVVCPARRHIVSVMHWELFALRDAENAQASPLHPLGILRDDYSPKLAFDRLRRTKAELQSTPESMSCGSVTQPITKVGMSVTDAIRRVSMFSTGATSRQTAANQVWSIMSPR
jgi:hypothetical protein